ncbi:MAG: response regulator, partial [Vicinamibacterales bacterium]
ARRILEDEGYHVSEASNGVEGIAWLETGSPLDLMIADLDMPVMRGEVMTQRVRALRPDLKILYVTGNIDSLMDDRPVLWEGEAFLEKPFSKIGLLEAVALLMFGTTKKRAR